MPLTKEQIEKWRAEFHEIIKSKYPHLDTRQSALGKYLYLGTDNLWQGFLMARSSVEIELPNFQLIDDPDGEGRGEYVMREVLEAKLERQGYKVKP